MSQECRFCKKLGHGIYKKGKLTCPKLIEKQRKLISRTNYKELEEEASWKFQTDEDIIKYLEEEHERLMDKFDDDPSEILRLDVCEK